MIITKQLVQNLSQQSRKPLRNPSLSRVTIDTADLVDLVGQSV